jgi:hypothetical protein
MDQIILFIIQIILSTIKQIKYNKKLIIIYFNKDVDMFHNNYPK